MIQRRACLQSLGALAAAVVWPAAAQTDFPSRPIRVLLPFAAGGAPDILARLITQAVTQQNAAYNFVIDNRPGGNGIIATDATAKAAADGYTLLYTTGSHTINSHVYKKIPYDIAKDFVAVTQVRTAPGVVLVVNPALPAKNLQEFLSLARAGKVAYGSPGVGNTLHLPGELLNMMAGAKMLHVPYKGAAPALNAVISGEIQAAFLSVTAALPPMKANQVRALAVSSPARLPGLPDVPTIAEAGVPGYEIDGGWQGFFAPAGTPADVVKKLSQQLAGAIRSPEIQQRILSDASVPVGNTSAEFEKFVAADAERVGKIVKSVGISID
ncbi:Bug family tripartite tricarboxylate transporter substrate binding protein [Hydrogenophaga sp. BPS33]|uniref:Bug family tripartite tricarboxylate transporter substrate binding protein n=1 Tax=Hydrogenophaga sp. BPS33 TaxID=2651974 RepID=UPI00131FE3F0|nr:tripartite tricarboxylate transporter substrate binding protein [Hydrogenophaga sp. BPS33]QHE86870.1 tripartite tricarboxylate transporter substrate binding protein [Hydrogenophaga sp. BPS33]